MTEFFNHPSYPEKAEEWQKLQVLYEGKHKAVTNQKYLWMDPLEQFAGKGAEIRAIREQRSRYLNFMKPVFSTWSSIFFKEDPALDDAVQALLGDAEKNIDGQGTSFISFIKNAVLLAFIRDGQPIVLVDAPPNPATNAQEERTAKFRPYFELLNVLNVKDWSLNPDGSYKWLRYEYEMIEDRDSPEEPPVTNTYSKTLSMKGGAYTITKYKLQKDGTAGKSQWVLISEQSVPGVTEIPVTTILNNDSWLDEVSEQQLVVFNKLSAWYSRLDNQAYEKTFAFVKDKSQAAIAMSEWTVALLDRDDRVETIPPADCSGLERAIACCIDWLFKVAFNRTRDIATGSKEAPGAETLREMKDEIISEVQASIETIENLVNRALKHYAMFANNDANFSGKVTFNRDITIDDFDMQILIFQAYTEQIKQNLPWLKASLKKAVERQNFTDDENEEINKEIDQMKPEPTLGDIMNARTQALGSGSNTLGTGPRDPLQGITPRTEMSAANKGLTGTTVANGI